MCSIEEMTFFLDAEERKSPRLNRQNFVCEYGIGIGPVLPIVAFVGEYLRQLHVLTHPESSRR